MALVFMFIQTIYKPVDSISQKLTFYTEREEICSPLELTLLLSIEV